MINIEYPFERYYVVESKASVAEKIYWQANRESAQVAYAMFKTYEGYSAIQEVYINNEPLQEILRKMNKSR